MSWPALKRLLSPVDFDLYVSALSPDSLSWAKLIVVHNTWDPKLADWPNVPGDSRMRGLENFYRVTQGWSGGPHLFVGREGIWLFTPLTEPGVHSPAWNHCAWGVETTGDWDTEQVPDDLYANLVSALTTLCRAGNILPSTLRFHYEDPLTTHKRCPGKNLDKANLVTCVERALPPMVST